MPYKTLDEIREKYNNKSFAQAPSAVLTVTLILSITITLTLTLTLTLSLNRILYPPKSLRDEKKVVAFNPNVIATFTFHMQPRLHSTRVYP